MCRAELCGWRVVGGWTERESNICLTKTLPVFFWPWTQPPFARKEEFSRGQKKRVAHMFGRRSLCVVDSPVIGGPLEASPAAVESGTRRRMVVQISEFVPNRSVRGTPALGARRGAEGARQPATARSGVCQAHGALDPLGGATCASRQAGTCALAARS